MSSKFYYGVAYLSGVSHRYFAYESGHFEFTDNVFRAFNSNDEMAVNDALNLAVKEYEEGRLPSQPFPILIEIKVCGADRSAFDRVVLEKTKKKALAKLTPQEKVALGLET